MSEEVAYGPSEWAARRRARAMQARMVAVAAIGSLLAVVGVVLGLVEAVRRDALLGSAIAVISAMLGIVILLVGSLLDTRRETRRGGSSGG